MTPEKWEVYIAIARKVESNGSGDDVSRNPSDLAMQQDFIDTFARHLPAPARVLAPGAISEAAMLAERGYETHALVLGRDNVRWLNDARSRLPDPNLLVVRERDAHDLDYPANFFDGYFTVQVHEHWIAPHIHVGEVRYCSRDGAIAFVDACGTTNPAQRQIWHTNLVNEEQVLEQWQYWGFDERWRGNSGNARPQFVVEKLPAGHSSFKNSGYVNHIMRMRAAL